MKLDEELSKIFNEESDEYKTLVEVNRILLMNTPSIASEAKTKMMILDSCKSKLSSMYFLINRAISFKRREVQESYDSQYTRLVKLGRPSNSAIEAEIRNTNPQFVEASQKIEDLESVKELISHYMRCIDSYKATATEILRDSRRID